ncbi:MAG: nicotinate (nicotinamide) nucleotide adenylyltransferase [Tunicatimonas sp.]|uniref:nicotinate (nicotinamide) nucleotide adenylyltransferase n=1 Tax=Tunicatimonas sp. TaxID=1940096 RepID=UPI003C70ECAD
MKVGLFFGSFNPIHTGHLIVANVVRQQAALDQVWFVVSPQNPFKKQKALLNEIDRLRMVELAVEDNFDLRACNAEFSMPKPSYTVNTLAYLNERYPQHQFSLILGSDNLTHLHRWKNAKEILTHTSVLVYPRPNVAEEKIKDEIRNHPNIKKVESPLLDISATFIRRSIRSRLSVKYLVPDLVKEYIQSRKLYL